MPHDDLKVPQLIPQRTDEADALAGPPSGPPAAVSESFIIPPAPLPVAPWWASSTPDPTPPESVTNPSPTLAAPVPVEALVPEPPPVLGPAPVAVAAPPQAYEPPAAPPVAAPPQEPSQALDALVAPPPAPEAPIIVVEPLQAPEPVPAAPLVPHSAPEPPPAPPAAPETLVDRILSTGPQPTVQAPPPASPPAGREDRAVRNAPPPPPLESPPPSPAPPPVPVPSSARRPRSALLAGLAVGAGVAVTALAAVLVAVSGKEDVPVRTVAAAGTAGGLRKDAATPATSAAYPFMLAAARAGGVERAATAGGVYRDPVTGAQNILFLGGTAPIGDPVAFLAKARPSTALTVAETVPGKGGGKVSCGTFAVLAQTHLYCAWATENSFGFVASNEPAGTGQPAGLAPLTGRMRADLEKRSP
ncbi:hypothetical protein ACFY4C_15225 [Actinomadura viridis]|uniref:hypothetical protein n=1 Tax=Actinomadura viridis TaxID=58110 RepID=UPI00367DF6C2